MAEERSIVSSLTNVLNYIKEHHYTEQAEKDLNKDLYYLNKMLGTDPEESVLFAFIMENQNMYNSIDDLSDYLGCSNIETVLYQESVDALVHRRILYIKDLDKDFLSYGVTPEAMKAIKGNQVYTLPSISGLSEDSIFSEFRRIFLDFERRRCPLSRLKENLFQIIDANPQSVFVQNWYRQGLNECLAPEQCLFLYMSHQYVSYNNTTIDSRRITDFVEEDEDEQLILKYLLSEVLRVVKSGMIILTGDGGQLEGTRIELSADVQNSFFSEVHLLGKLEVTHSDLIKCDKIAEKQLFYNDTERHQMEHLNTLLKGENFQAVQQRLEECGMRKGFNVILYGGPGTGKTESVLQIARATERNIFQIDASKLKSKWMGESEKQVKGAFHIYRNMVRTNKTCPILFFNEADAIFGKRIQHVESALEQCMNTIQNIILQEMENLEGIMICTTNLEKNLDPAFERRFLYKVKLNQPEPSTRKQIWMSMIPTLSDSEAEKLAENYDFSGGNIENIFRKSTVDYVLTGDKTSFSQLETYCQEENFKRHRHAKIGYGME